VILENLKKDIPLQATLKRDTDCDSNRGPWRRIRNQHKSTNKKASFKTMSHFVETMMSFKHHSNMEEHAMEENDTGSNDPKSKLHRQTEPPSPQINDYRSSRRYLSIRSPSHEINLSLTNGRTTSGNRKKPYRKAVEKHPLSAELLEELCHDLDE